MMKTVRHLILGLGAGLLVMGCGRNSSGGVVASGTVEATEADLGFQAAGRIDSILVQEGDRVQAGDRLASLDRREALARRTAAAEQLKAQQARLAELERGYRPEEIAQVQAALRAAERRFADAERDRTRSRNLFAGGAISQQTLDGAETAYAVAEAERDRLQEQARLFQEGPRQEQITAQRAVVGQAMATVEQAEAFLAYAEITAPFAGTISRRLREPGEVVSPGLPVLTLINPGDRWIRIYVREDELGRVSLGQAASIRIDTFPDRTYQGQVSFIASEAEFTPRNVQTAEERVKLVYRVKVRVVADSALDLKPGLSADVELDEGR
ncbi:MAG: HlyD family efflux transporter periplasmic adaptor subunit [Gemmatimonadota bacterium]|jgi:HlyD family secretion protein|nr:HlyD family efflux transporter periplasmic adaptor subunit [Gemmatimonadota bacterium]